MGSNTEGRKEKLDQFFARFAGADTSLLLLDFDGTLAPFRVDRFRARPWAGVRELLDRIQKQNKTRIVVITGRPADEIAPLLGLDKQPEVWGLHGAERLRPDGRHEREMLAPRVSARLEEVCAHLRRDAFGGLFEEKPNAAVMHWRGATAEKARQIEKSARELFEPLTLIEGLRLLEFEAGLELRAGRDKGGAVKAVLEEAGAGKPMCFPVAYLGDDFTDEIAFAALKGRGLSVLVRRQWRETVADVWFKPPADLKQFLKTWVAADSKS